MYKDDIIFPVWELLSTKKKKCVILNDYDMHSFILLKQS